MRTDGTPYVADSKPIVQVKFYNSAGTQVGSTYDATNRVVHVRKKEEPFTGNATIRLLNQDGALNAVNFLGTRVEIYWQWTGGLSSKDGPVWVVAQKYISSEGKLLLQLDCLDAWELMEQSRGLNAADSSDPVDPAFGTSRTWDRDTTILDIIAEIIGAVDAFLEEWNMDTITQINDDGIIDVYEPLFFSRINDPDTELIRRLLQMTESVMTFRHSGPLVNWIDQSLPGPYYTYEIQSTDHPFFINIEGEALTIPNRIIYVDQEPDPNKGEVSNFVGVAEMATFPLGKFGQLRIDDTIEDDTEAQLRASSHLARLVGETELGEIYVPMNTCVELYDEIEIIDSRSGVTHYGRVGQIERLFQATANDIEQPNSQRESFTTRIKLGGIGGGSTRIKSHADGINDVDTTISDLKTRSTYDPFKDTPQYSGSVLSQHLAPYLFRKNATVNTTFATGTLGDITGATLTFDIPTDSVVKLDFFAHIQCSVAPAVGDIFFVTVDVNGATKGAGILFVAQFATIHTFPMPSMKSLIINLPAGSNTIKLRGQRISGAGTWVVLGAAGETGFVGLVSSRKNTTNSIT